MKTSWLWILLACCLVSTAATAQRLTKFQQLSRAMVGHLRPLRELDPDHKLIDCSGVPPTTLAAINGSTYAQYIYNHFYQWTTIDTGEGDCVYLSDPFKRGLTVEEVQMLLSASMRQWPVDPTPQRPLRPEEELNGGKPITRENLLPDKMERPNPNETKPCCKQGQKDC